MPDLNNECNEVLVDKKTDRTRIYFAFPNSNKLISGNVDSE